MEDISGVFSWELQHLSKRSSETCSDDDEDILVSFSCTTSQIILQLLLFFVIDGSVKLIIFVFVDDPDYDFQDIPGLVADRRSTSHALLQEWDSVSLLYPQSNNQPAITSGVVPNHTNGSTSQACQPPNIPNAALLKRNFSSLSEPERVQRKKKSDQLYRDKCKLKSEYEKQNVLVQTLSGLLADPVQLENEKLKDENASLRKYANLNGYLPLLAEENANLKIENKVLKVQNDALCGKIISENDKKCEQNTI
ncbi:uncharacterized protein LOC111296210 isoform X3 [Durio zibethinus]|uniref:Uncharacterized protein LOC111296210 isoform X3 n=1 Tax=Durio zibethinus TaxID=66656 RepID=A0A6P5Z0R0_DURZI|nr:uncharacterized protein LOC111296210 isoform X3 [Durio zibethinus]